MKTNTNENDEDHEEHPLVTVEPEPEALREAKRLRSAKTVEVGNEYSFGIGTHRNLRAAVALEMVGLLGCADRPSVTRTSPRS